MHAVNKDNLTFICFMCVTWESQEGVKSESEMLYEYGCIHEMFKHLHNIKDKMQLDQNHFLKNC